MCLVPAPSHFDRRAACLSSAQYPLPCWRGEISGTSFIETFTAFHTHRDEKQLKMWIIGFALVSVFVIYCTHFMYLWRNPKCDGVLPPGTSGFPIIGETLQLLSAKSFDSYDIHPFIKERVRRYGPIFRTSFVGRPAVVSTDPEVNRYIAGQEGKLVELWYLDSFSKFFVLDGESRVNAMGRVHKYIRGNILNYFSGECLREKMLPNMEELLHRLMSRAASQETMDMKQAVFFSVFTLATKQVCGFEDEAKLTKISANFINFKKSIMSFPVNIPGTTFHKCMKDKEAMLNMMKETMEERLRSPDPTRREDLLDQLIADMGTEKILTKEFIPQLAFGILFASLESLASPLTLAIKFLADYPSVVEELTAEHEAILKNRKNLDSKLSWEEYKSMTFTHQVINETLRLSNTAPGLLRRSLKDIHIKGYTIPAGWTIMLVSHVVQLNPEVYQDPFAFNPWRWKDLDPTVTSKCFMPFGAGSRHCAGAEFSKLFMATFIHVLVTKYRWAKIKGGSICRNPLLQFPEGLHFKISAK